MNTLTVTVLLQLLFGSSAQAEECPLIAIAPSTVIKTALDQRWPSMSEVVSIELDLNRPDRRVLFRSSPASPYHYMNFQTCGDKITFSEIKQL